MPRSTRNTANPPAGDVVPARRGQATRAVVKARPARRFLAALEDLHPLALSATMQKYALSALDAHSDPDIETFSILGGTNHYRVTFAESRGAGTAEFCNVAEGFFVCTRNDIRNAPIALAVSAPDMLRVRIASEGDGEYTAANGEVLDAKGPGAVIIIEPAGTPPAEAVLAGHQKTVHVYIHRDALARLYAGDEQGLPPEVQHFLAGTLEQTVARRLPLSPDLLRYLDDLQGCALEGRSRRLFFQSTAINILCHAFDALTREEGFGTVEASALTARGVLKAQLLLAENYVEPPSLDELAQHVGLSRTNLCTGFRQIIGQSVFDYVADLRMRHALDMLNRSDHSITQIAHEVGFSQLSSFTMAVQRRFGATPSELRRRGLPAG